MYLRKSFFTTLLLFICAISFAQLTGRVVNFEDNEGIPGANVIIKGATGGTITDIDGNFTIEVKTGDTLQVSFIGFNTEEVVVFDQTEIDITLVPTIEMLQEVVVTALGIKRDEKALGYSIQKVGGDDVSEVKEIDVINALSGKVAGVNIMQADGTVGGGGSRIVIRGENSLSGCNEPLYIINGVRGEANDIAADDIESISVLKGAAAAALYGSDAGAGVILITSKKGSGNKGMQVSVNSNMTFQNPLVLPDYQNEYGMGSGGAYSYYDGSTNSDPYWDDTKYNWGPKFDGETRSQFTGNNPWVAYPDNVSDFYELGHVYINNIAVANSSENGQYRVSYTNTDQAGILPNTGLSKNNIGLSSEFKINDRLTISSNISYIRTNCANDAEVDVRFIQRNVDISALENYWVSGLEGYQQYNYRQSANNPYFVLYENTESTITNKMVANVAVNYNPVEGLNLMGRYGTNYSNEEYYEQHAYSTYKKEVSDDLNGYYKSGMYNMWDYTADFLASYERELFSGFKARASFGGSTYRYEYKRLEAATYNIEYEGIWNLNNRSGNLDDLVDNIEKAEKNSLYAFLNLDYQGKLFLDITDRHDWSSTMYIEHNNYNYPSISLSALMTEIFDLPQAISFWKMRGSVAKVGNDIPVAYYTVDDKTEFYVTNSGLTTLTAYDVQVDSNGLEPEMTTGYEVGSDIRLLNNRLGLDVTAYYSITENQIMLTEASSASDWNYALQNVGTTNSKGLEITVSATPVKTNDFKWETQVNWSIDRTYILELDLEGTDQITQSVNKHLSLVSKEGERVGNFYGYSYVTYNGKTVYTQSGDTEIEDEQEILGNYNPDWMGSWNNTFTYKNLSLSFLFDLRWGGLIYNNTERLLNMYGLSAATSNRDEGIVPDGYYLGEDGEYYVLTLEDLESYGKTGGLSAQEYWTTISEESVAGNSLVDATYLKLRELRLGYNLPKQWLDKTFFSSMNVALVGRNLYVWSKVKHIDPEIFGIASEQSAFGFNTQVPGYANSSVPSVRSMGITLSCKF